MALGDRPRGKKSSLESPPDPTRLLVQLARLSLNGFTKKEAYLFVSRAEKRLHGADPETASALRKALKHNEGLGWRGGKPLDSLVFGSHLNMIITKECPENFLAYVTSPQLPGYKLPLQGEGMTSAEADLLAEHFQAAAVNRFHHAQILDLGTSGGEADYLIRWQFNAHDGLKRHETADALAACVTYWRDHPETSPRYGHFSRERLFVVADGNDPLWWIANQLLPGELATLAPNDPRLSTKARSWLAFARNDVGESVIVHESEEYLLEEIGLTLNSTYAEYADAMRKAFDSGVESILPISREYGHESVTARFDTLFSAKLEMLPPANLPLALAGKTQARRSPSEGRCSAAGFK